MWPFGDSIKDTRLKEIKSQLNEALLNAQLSLDEVNKMRYGAFINREGVSEADARNARVLYKNAMDRLREDLQKIAASVKSDYTPK